MSEINTVNLLNQIRSMAAQAEGGLNAIDSKHTPFGQVFQNALNQVNDMSETSNALKTKYELGDPNVSIGEVMIASQKSSLAFEATLRVRNKVVQAYQDIMNMPV
ncbi:flagellar hook-basal body complex protein FliE [Legionella worsleiensis]|uniref:Flagellar hook-basal body complex protein FliE n=1 Tax=Legionella worsleiensis TaxID=45076 RepID=A0A0W1A484_9GAMM|nr:flagellar hook-basal body complex protein FliE [Legionella worsleiensis]KTD76159.1 flagellar hook-basal body complex protein [Legionella worsleiensis]STY33265.1 flagellar hook-basal body complex protein FliE [Legionella worsleiensis]